MNIQEEYDIIYSIFKHTSEPFDILDWNGNEVNIFFDNELIESYSKEDISELKIFKLDTSLVGNYEMQHLNFAYASSLIMDNEVENLLT